MDITVIALVSAGIIVFVLLFAALFNRATHLAARSAIALDLGIWIEENNLPNLSGRALLDYSQLSSPVSMTVISVSNIQIDYSLDVLIELTNGIRLVIVFDLNQSSSCQLNLGGVPNIKIIFREDFFEHDFEAQILEAMDQYDYDATTFMERPTLWEQIVFGPKNIAKITLTITEEMHSEIFGYS